MAQADQERPRSAHARLLPATCGWSGGRQILRSASADCVPRPTPTTASVSANDDPLAAGPDAISARSRKPAASLPIIRVMRNGAAHSRLPGSLPCRRGSLPSSSASVSPHRPAGRRRSASLARSQPPRQRSYQCPSDGRRPTGGPLPLNRPHRLSVPPQIHSPEMGPAGPPAEPAAYGTDQIPTEALAPFGQRRAPPLGARLRGVPGQASTRTCPTNHGTGPTTPPDHGAETAALVP